MQRDLHEANRLSWNEATRAHNSHKGDQAAYFRAGGSTLYPEELDMLGDIAGRSLLHLQCNSGQDSVSLARLGAQVTGVDISDEAINFAQRLSAESGLPANFERSDLLDWFDAAQADGRRFERVFTSYGTICWLSDLKAWARGVAGVLAPGGRFAMVEFHPFAMVFDPRWAPRHDYFVDGAIPEPDGVGDYVADSRETLALDAYHRGVENFRNPNPAFEFYWGIGQVVSALVEAGLTIERLEEYPYANGWAGFAGMRDLGGGRLAPPDHMPRIPLMYGLSATRSG
ncbi:MAG: SAM-dependent methyltransferase [Phenylobacterium sp.]|uniref:class I SAM-dependent methyltransferase n=1 Tax=Phenylobacterium sp. TaxID=1871053 RepID=UPI0025D94031|nr:class I SAM-dependent methyltransferase [Phenylobacterium sp.]MBA4013276.1 SAM-dependent methyltransferase [Phenylobacterium sp.]